MIEESFANSLYPSLGRLLNGEMPVEEKAVLPKYISISGDYWDEEEEDEGEHFTEESEPEKNTIVAILPIKGAITKYSQWCGPMGTREMKSRMDHWKGNDSIAAVLLDIDSGGGQVSGTAEFAEYVANYPKPVIVYSDGLICSAAYWLASGAKEIWANPHAEEIGSIGTMCKGLILEGIIEKAGGQVVEEYASKSTMKNHVWRELKKGNVQPLIKESLDPSNEKFLNMVKSHRPQLSEEVLDGRVFLDHEQSKAVGLIDHIGTKQEAINRAFELAKETPENNLNSNNSDMSKENSFPKLAAVLGVEGIEAKKANIFSTNETVSLTAEQLASIEAALADPGDSQKLADLQTELSTAKADKKKAEDKASALDAAVNSAIEKAGLTDEKKATSAENLDFLAEKVIEYGAKDGDKPTNVTTKGDKVEETDPESTSIYDSLVN